MNDGRFETRWRMLFKNYTNPDPLLINLCRKFREPNCKLQERSGYLKETHRHNSKIDHFVFSELQNLNTLFVPFQSNEKISIFRTILLHKIVFELFNEIFKFQFVNVSKK